MELRIYRKDDTRTKKLKIIIISLICLFFVVDCSNSTGYDVSSEVNSEGSSIDSGHGSRDSGASASPAAITQASAMKEGPVMYQFEFPSKLCGRLIGKSVSCGLLLDVVEQNMYFT